MWRPPSCGGPWQLPSLSIPKSGPANDLRRPRQRSSKQNKCSSKQRINDFKFQWNNQRRPRSVNNVNVDIFTCLGQWRSIVTPQRGRHSWNFLLPDIYGVNYTVSRVRNPRMLGRVGGALQENFWILGLWSWNGIFFILKALLSKI